MASLRSFTLVSALVVASLGVAAVGFHDERSSHPSTWDPRVADLAVEAERERDLDFRHPVRVDFVTAEEYSAQIDAEVGEPTEEERAEADSVEAQLRAVGLLSGDVDLDQAAGELVDAGTLAYYIPEEERIVIRAPAEVLAATSADQLPTELQLTVLHELTHALQDQHFGIGADREDAFETTQESSSFEALVEGDAVRIEDEFAEGLSEGDYEALLDAQEATSTTADEALAEVPAGLRALQAYPYIVGPGFVTLLDAYDPDTVDQAFVDPPSTDEHLLDVRSFLAGEAAVEVARAALPEGATETETGDFGALSWYLVLAQRIDPQLAFDAAKGWGGDTYLVYELAGRTCMAMTWQGDTADDHGEMQEALGAWTAAMPAEAGAAVTRDEGGVIEAVTCDPGPAAVDPVAPTPGEEVFYLPAIRAMLAEEAVRAGGLDLDAGYGYADCMISDLSASRVIELSVAEPTPEIEDEIVGATEICIEAVI